ncbi:MAG TPA: hypothetical protein VHM48_02850, partial [Candidatus Limnocylindrales bacterium]|nr:hypothetical protein [Candidatus Limnocylindrales bacterium]
TATVVDTDTAGTKLPPTGTVTFTRDGGLPVTCPTLTSTGTDRSACSVTWTSATPQVWVVVAKYNGSDVHVTSTSEAQIVVFYDPSGGFVTGGGYIKHEDPIGAANPNTPGVAGKDNFGFNAKYLKNATVPTGETEFQCKVCNLNFHSTSYDWLVITRLSTTTVKAQYRGLGTINGAAGYGFIVTVIDGGQTDTARIRIWNTLTGATVYDNEYPKPDSANPTTITAGGNIVVHDK